MFLTVIAMAAAVAAPAPSSPDRILTSHGLGQVEVGMSVKQAEQVLHIRLKIDDSQEPGGECVYAYETAGPGAQVGYMVIKGKIQRIDIQLKGDASIKTQGGLGLGATQAGVRGAYGRGARHDQTDPNDDGPPDENSGLIVKDPNGKSGIRFGFQKGALAWLIAGNYPALSFYEGCL